MGHTPYARYVCMRCYTDRSVGVKWELGNHRTLAIKQTKQPQRSGLSIIATAGPKSSNLLCINPLDAMVMAAINTPIQPK